MSATEWATAAAPAAELRPASGYDVVREALAAERCVVLDGGIGTELPEHTLEVKADDERLWGTRALVEAADPVLGIHRRYAEAGCDVITTNIWAYRPRSSTAPRSCGSTPARSTGWTWGAAG